MLLSWTSNMPTIVCGKKKFGFAIGCNKFIYVESVWSLGDWKELLIYLIAHAKSTIILKASKRSWMTMKSLEMFRKVLKRVQIFWKVKIFWSQKIWSKFFLGWIHFLGRKGFFVKKNFVLKNVGQKKLFIKKKF